MTTAPSRTSRSRTARGTARPQMRWATTSSLDLPAGTYTLTATKSGYSFKQSFTGSVTVPPDANNKDFEGWKTCDPPAEPFLDLPLAYDRTNAVYNFLWALQNWNLGGVNSWFDHRYPNYRGQSDGLQLYYHTDGPLDEDWTWLDHFAVMALHQYVYVTTATTDWILLIGHRIPQALVPFVRRQAGRWWQYAGNQALVRRTTHLRTM